jgi:hypothetical protein
MSGWELQVDMFLYNLEQTLLVVGLLTGALSIVLVGYSLWKELD